MSEPKRIKEEDLPKIGDTVECDACHGKGWYSMSPATDDENFNDHYHTDHDCDACDRFGYLIITGFYKEKGQLKVNTKKDYDEGWYEEDFGF